MSKEGLCQHCRAHQRGIAFAASARPYATQYGCLTRKVGYKSAGKLHSKQWLFATSRFSCFAQRQPDTRAGTAFLSDGVESPKIRVADFKGLRGVAAIEDIAEGETFATVPFKAALVVQPTKQTPFPDFCSQENWKQSPWFLKLALRLLYERRLGASSAFQAYTEDLPKQIDTPMEWSSEELRELHNPHLEAEIQKQQQSWKRLHSDFTAANPQSSISHKEFLWAMQAVRSRAFSGPYGGPPLRSRAKLAVLLAAAGVYSLNIAHIPIEQVLNAGIAAVLFNILYDIVLSRKVKWYAMLPVIDYCNHSCQVESNVGYEYFRECFTASCSRAFQKGEQVFISYGNQGNDHLLQFYGFVEPDNPWDRYTIDRLASHSQAGIRLPERVVLTRKGSDAETLAAMVQLNPGVEVSAKGSPIYKALVEVCRAEITAQPTSLEQDQALAAKSRPISERLRTAVAFRLQKKALLGACLMQLSKRAGIKEAQKQDGFGTPRETVAVKQ